MMKSNSNDENSDRGIGFGSSSSPSPSASATASDNASTKKTTSPVSPRSVMDEAAVVVQGGGNDPQSSPSSSSPSLLARSTPSPAPKATTATTIAFGTSNTSTDNTSHTVLFPWKLHEMLTAAHKDGRDDIVSWLPDGEAFKVHNVVDFVSDILPSFFKQTKYKSFQRQLNLWGFERILSGPQKGAYSHPKFLQDQPDLCSTLTRQRAKKGTVAAAATGASSAKAAIVSTEDATTKVNSPDGGASTVTPSSASDAGTTFAPSLSSDSKKCTPAKTGGGGTVVKPKSPAGKKRKNSAHDSSIASKASKKAKEMPSLMRLDGGIPPSVSTMLPRQVSDTCLDVVNDFFLSDPPVTFEGLHLAQYDQLPLDLAEFEGFTFHLLENERCEELNHEFKFVPGAESSPSAPSATLQHQQLMLPLPMPLPLPPPPQLTSSCPHEIDYYYSSSSSSSSSSTSPGQDSGCQPNESDDDEDLTGGNAQKLLRELEQGVFGIPKTAFDMLSV